MSLFGEIEMREFAESSSDERVKVIWRRLQESKSNAAKWCDAFNKLQADAKRYRFIRDKMAVESSPGSWCLFDSAYKGSSFNEAIDKEMKRMGYE